MTIYQAIREAMIRLKDAKIEDSSLKAKLLMEFVLNQPRQYIVVNDIKELTINEEIKYKEYIDKILEGYPIEYITNDKEFMKLNFFVNESVLIPRQDTEILVEETIKLAHENKFTDILDLCTGSGAIAVSLAKYIQNSIITAVDISLDALEVAKKNANKNKVCNRINFIKSDMFLQLQEQEFDMIVSNPPYIKREVIEGLSEEVKKEPHIALDGGEDGLDFYRNIINNSNKYLKEAGYLCLEIGFDQKNDILKILIASDKFEDIYVKKDLYGNDRVIIAKLKVKV